MPYPLIISATELKTLQSAEPAGLMVFDCSFDLMQPEVGKELFAKEHIAGAVYADLNQNLSAHDGQTKASGGRHPLPSREDFAHWLTSIGFQNTMQAVVYDRNQNNYCVRLWWMLKWLGHENVAVLDGGLNAWKAAGGAVESGIPDTANAATAQTISSVSKTNKMLARPSAAIAKPFQIQASIVELINAEQVLAHLHDGSQTIIDARAKPRYRGEVEPIDKVAGHIPGALNRPFGENFQESGLFKTPANLREEFAAVLQGKENSHIIHQCGSGVSATPNVLAMMIAGYPAPALYAGSWSDWISDSSRPIEKL